VERRKINATKRRNVETLQWNVKSQTMKLVVVQEQRIVCAARIKKHAAS